jgi:CBS domain-containing protein
MLLAKDFMSPHVITCHPDLSIFDAAELLVDNHVTGIPVVDQQNNLIGILSEYDILRVLKECSPEDNKTVNDFMTRTVISFPDTAPTLDIWEFFIDNPTKRRVPIVSNGKLVGVVSRGDIVKQIIMLHKEKG